MRWSLLSAAFSSAWLSPQARAPVEPALVVHEWGTFTTVMAPGGMPVRWRPFLAEGELPTFVHDTPPERQQEHGVVSREKGQIMALVRMETPVVYFYTDAPEPVPVTLSVQYRDGLLTEWFPRARLSDLDAAGETLSWQAVQILPRTAASLLPEDGSGSHYYEARAVAANAVQDPVSGEIERFLFYRGVGNALPTLRVREGSDGALSVLTDRARGTAVLFTRAAGGLPCWRTFEVLSGIAAPGVPECGPQAALESVLVARLLEEGLWADEAAAMVATWRHHWFEPGTRVFSVVPRETTDYLLPLQVTPAPVSTVRVMMERTELIRQADVERLRQIRAAGGQEAEVQAAFGRFADAVVASAQLAGVW